MSRRTILVADDSLEDIVILQRAFAKAGINVPVQVVNDGQEAIDYLSNGDRATHLPRLMVLDLKMPRMDGFDVLTWLREHSVFKLLPVTVLTSSGEGKDVDRAYALGANSYVVKPTSLDGYEALAEKLRGYWLELNEPPTFAA